MLTDLGRWLIVAGLLFILLGAAMLLLGRIPWLGHLPGDIVIRREHLTGFIPFGTMLLLSLILTLLANLIARLWR